MRWARGGVALVAYALLAITCGPSGLGQSNRPYFTYLANSFLHGRLSLIDTPSATHDLSLFHGAYYLYWPPFPALILMPVVAIFGSAASDVVFDLVVAAVNVVLVWLLLALVQQRLGVDLPRAKRALLTAGLAFGSVHATLAPYGQVWFTSQLVAFALSCATYVVALASSPRRTAIPCGVLTACALLTRTPLVLAAGWVPWHLYVNRDRADGRATLKLSLAFVVPISLAVLALGLYDLARFGNPLDFGYGTQQRLQLLDPTFQRYGAFSIHSVPVNFFYNFVAVPYLALLSPNHKAYLWMGGSLFLMSPYLLLAFPGIRRSWRTHGWALALTIVVALLPMLFLTGTGYLQFGPRYTLDVMAPLLIATAFGASQVSMRTLVLLTEIAVLIYLPGAAIFGLAALR